MPAAHDDEQPPPFALIGDDTGDVAFLDAPAMALGELGRTMEQELAALPAGAVLAVYSRLVPGAAFAELCARLGLRVVATIPHPDGGTSYTVAAGRGRGASSGTP